MYAPTSIAFVRRTRAPLRSAECGFFGVVVYTRVQTPRFCGAPRSAGVFTFAFGAVRPFRTSWLTVGMGTPPEGLHTTKAGGATATANPGVHGSEGRSDASNGPSSGVPRRPIGRVYV